MYCHCNREIAECVPPSKYQPIVGWKVSPDFFWTASQTQWKSILRSGSVYGRGRGAVFTQLSEEGNPLWREVCSLMGNWFLLPGSWGLSRYLFNRDVNAKPINLTLRERFRITFSLGLFVFPIVTLSLFPWGWKQTALFLSCFSII